MRNLTITRRKSYVGSIMKDKVYIRDEAAAERHILIPLHQKTAEKRIVILAPLYY